MEARKTNPDQANPKEETKEGTARGNLRMALKRKLQELENAPDLSFKSPEIIILAPVQENDDMFDSIRIEYSADGGFAIKGKTRVNSEIIRKMIANIYASPTHPLLVYAEGGEGINIKDVLKQKILKFRSYALQYFAEQKMPQLSEKALFDLYWEHLLGVLFYWTGDKDKELREKLLDLENMLEEAKLSKPELVIVVPYEFDREEKSYYMAHVSYLKGWADLGYKETKVKQWCRVIKHREIMESDEVADLAAKYFDSPQKFPPVILGDPVTSPDNMEEEAVKSYEAKILKFRRHAVEYWTKHQV
ncbi:MAG: hypothetical protein PHE84_16145 [bacterium]|nr:hypothetical protein [bacterium]